MKKTVKEIVLDYIININNGIVTLPDTLFPYTLNIKTIKGIYFNEQFDLDIEDECSVLWNNYVDRIQNAIGVKYYCVWIRNNNNDIVGILAFYDPDGNEIKMKHFEDWKLLLSNIIK